MRRLAWLLLVGAIILGGRTFAQSRPDFSGVWKGSAGPLTVQQTGTTLTIGEGADKRVYNLDGSESRFTLDRSQLTARARWSGSALVVEIATASTIGSWTDVEIYSLDYGPTLSVVKVRSQMTRTVMYTTVDTYTRPKTN